MLSAARQPDRGPLVQLHNPFAHRFAAESVLKQRLVHVRSGIDERVVGHGAANRRRHRSGMVRIDQQARQETPDPPIPTACGRSNRQATHEKCHLHRGSVRSVALSTMAQRARP